LELQEWLIGRDDELTSADREALISIGHRIIEEEPPGNRIKIIQIVHELFYDTYGHILEMFIIY
jgi:hypothetical protein